VHDLAQYLPSELGKILNAETIISGTCETSKPVSTVAAIGLAVLTGGMFATKSATMNMDFTSTTDEELVVNYHNRIQGTLGSDAQGLINVLMRKVSRRIPYTK
jgi:hypothetical protein